MLVVNVERGSGCAGCNGSGDIWGWLWFSCGIVHGVGVFVWGGAQGRGLTSVFERFSASVNKGFILAWGLGAGLLFYWV